MIHYQTVTNLISELLFKHDCVIVPNFGGFVARNVSSSFSKGNNLLYPQTKQVLFNKNLIHNDGLLTTALMQKLSITFGQAAQNIDEYKDYIQSLLGAKKRFELNDIGLLYIDTDNSLRFEPKVNVNFLLNTFGFEPVVANELILQKEQLINKSIFEDRKAVIDPLIKQKTMYRKYAALAIGVPLTLAFLLFAASTKPIKPYLESTLNPFYSATKTYNPAQNQKLIALITNKEINPIEFDANGFANFKLTTDGASLVASVNESTSLTTSTKKITVNNKINFNGNYQVVVGCFGVEGNAHKLINELITNNINAGISGTNAKGLHVVSCGGFSNKDEATALLTSIKNQYPNAWVMAK